MWIRCLLIVLLCVFCAFADGTTPKLKQVPAPGYLGLPRGVKLWSVAEFDLLLDIYAHKKGAQTIDIYSRGRRVSRTRFGSVVTNAKNPEFSYLNIKTRQGLALTSTEGGNVSVVVFEAPWKKAYAREFYRGEFSTTGWNEFEVSRDEETGFLTVVETSTSPGEETEEGRQMDTSSTVYSWDPKTHSF